VRNASGRAVRLIGSTGDITELKERERELADQVAEQTAVRELLEAISRSGRRQGDPGRAQVRLGLC
jgi:hypothetical protein